MGICRTLLRHGVLHTEASERPGLQKTPRNIGAKIGGILFLNRMQRAPRAEPLEPPPMEQPMPFHAQVQRLLPEERAIWEQLQRTLDALLACMRRAPQTWQADATYHADLAAWLAQVGTALQKAGLEAAPFAWETAAVSEHYAHQLLRMGTEATGAWVG